METRNHRIAEQRILGTAEPRKAVKVVTPATMVVTTVAVIPILTTMEAETRMSKEWAFGPLFPQNEKMKE
jgi:hypothetical protein